MPALGSTTKSDERRLAIIDAAITHFSRKGFYGTTTHEIAAAAGISQPYVYRLYSSKEALFAAAVDRVSVIMSDALTHGQSATDAAAGDSLVSARAAYTSLVADPAILRFLMHANCAADEPLVAEAVRRCYAKQVGTVRTLLDDDEAVRLWFGAGMLENVVSVLGLETIDEDWAKLLSSR